MNQPMTGQSTSALQAKNTTTTAGQKFLNGRNPKNGLKGASPVI